MKGKSFTAEDIARQGRARLKAKADPKRASGIQKYFKESVKSYGLKTDDVRAIAADLYASVKKDWTTEDAMALCDLVFQDAELEGKSIGSLVLGRFKKSYPRGLFDRIKSWLAADLLSNWASVDTLCPEVVGTLIVVYPELEQEIKRWAFHPNRWVKRASAVSFIKLAKKKEYHETIYAIAASLFPVDDDLVQKANGWLLRETGKVDMNRLEAFLLRHGPSIPRTTLRYAIERFEEKKRKSLLEKTKALAGD